MFHTRFGRPRGRTVACASTAGVAAPVARRGSCGRVAWRLAGLCERGASGEIENWIRPLVRVPRALYRVSSLRLTDLRLTDLLPDAMRIAIITHSSEHYSTQRLQEAADRRGHDVVVLPVPDGSIVLRGDAVEITAKGVPILQVDVVIPRIPATRCLAHALCVLRQLELGGTATLNSSGAIEEAGHKFRALARLASRSLPIPRTSLVRHVDSVSWAIEHVGGAPVVIKPVIGSRGEGVVRGDTLDGARSAAESLLLVGQELLVQEYISESEGRDVRVIVCGGRVVCAVRREAPPGRFRSNVQQGGRATSFEPSSELSMLAIRATRELGLEVAGVDILESDHGPLVVEVNASPGLRAIEEATGVDVAAHFVGHLESRCSDRLASRD